MTLEVESSLASFSSLVDRKVGIIHSVELVALSENDPQVYLAYAEPADTTPLTGIKAANKGAACATTSERAILRACGEALERYCSAFFDKDEMPVGAASQLREKGSRVIATDELYPFLDSQYRERGFPFRRASAKDPIRWVLGNSFSGVETWLPASCVYVPYYFEANVEPFTHMPISTGLAAGRDVERCIEKGICEILERDALMITWAHRISPPRITIDSCRGLTHEVDALLDALPLGSELFINYLTLDLDVPILSAALIDTGDPPLTSFGVAADLDIAKALQSAIEEAILTRLLVNRSAGSERSYDPGSIRTLHDHLCAHAFSSELRASMEFLVSGGQLQTFDAAAQRAGGRLSAREAIRAAGLDGAWIDVTTPDVEQLGFKVVRTVIPGCQPLDNDHVHRYLGGRRLRSVPIALGYPDLPVGAYNPNPHPFP